MHTLKPAGNNLWDVLFIGTERNIKIESALPKPEALKLVNYLNGGTGNAYGEPLRIKEVSYLD